MKSSSTINKINNRIIVIFPLIIISGFASFMFFVCNFSLLMTGGNIHQLINGCTIPFEMGLCIPVFTLLVVYYLKLSSILNRIEERS